MIYTDEFVWLHFPKCAGSKIEQLFKNYFFDDEGLHQDPVDPLIDPTASWHHTISNRENHDPQFKLGDRMVICSFRKLSSWLESRYNYEVERSPDLPHRPELVLEGKFLESNGMENHADYYAKLFLPEPILKSDKLKFLRTEFFESDFKSIFGNYLDISRIPDWEFEQKLNVSVSHLPVDIKKQLYSKNNKVYDSCPYWQLVEDIAYAME